MKIGYLPARLAEWGSRWMIVFHQTNPSTGKMERVARSYKLNRIKSRGERRKAASRLIKELNDTLLPAGYPFVEVESSPESPALLLRDAVEMAVKLKHSNRKATNEAYRYTANFFLEFLLKKKWDSLGVKGFTKLMARQFLDYVIIDKGLGAVSHNNLGAKLRSLFAVLLERGHVDDNPFNGFTKMKEPQAERRPMTDKEKAVISAEIKKRDRRLYLFVNIMYYCLIRKSEMYRLKFRYFDFKEGVIRLPGDVTKNTKTQMVTMPKALSDMLIQEYDFKKYPGHWLVFGQNMRPHASKTCSKNSATYKHRKIVDDLAKLGKISEPKTIHLYSWKNNGVLRMVEEGLNILEIKEQLRHSSLETTQRYLKSLASVNHNIRNLSGDI